MINQNLKNVMNSNQTATDFFKKAVTLEPETSPASLSALNKFKEDMFKQFKEIENKIYIDSLDYRKELSIKVNNIEQIAKENSDKIRLLSEQFAATQVQMEKIKEVEKAQKRVTEDSITQSLRIKNLDKAMNDGFYKYDRLYLDNLVIPGLIGEYSKFKTFKDFAEYISSNTQSLLNFKDKNTLDLKNYKEKLEGLINQFSLQMSQTDRKNKDYTNIKFEILEKQFFKEREETEKRLDGNRLENTKHCKELVLTTESLRLEQSKIDDFKKNIDFSLKEGIEKMKKMNVQTSEEFDSVKDEFSVFKRKFNDIAEFIKDIRFRRNLGADVQKREVKSLTNKLEYHPHSEYIKEIDLKDTENYFTEENEENNLSHSHKPSEHKEENHKNLNEVESVVKSYIHGKKQKLNLNTIKSTLDAKILSRKNELKENKEGLKEDSIEQEFKSDYEAKKNKDYSLAISRNKDYPSNQIYSENVDAKITRVIDCIKEELDESKTEVSDINSSAIKEKELKAKTIHITNTNKKSSTKSSHVVFTNPMKTTIASESQMTSNDTLKNLANELNYFKSKAFAKIEDSERKIQELENYIKSKLEPLNYHKPSSNQSSQALLFTGYNQDNNKKGLVYPNLGNIQLKNSTPTTPYTNLNIAPDINSRKTSFPTLSHSSIINPSSEQMSPNNFSNYNSNAGTIMIADSVYNKNITYNFLETNSGEEKDEAKRKRTHSSNKLLLNNKPLKKALNTVSNGFGLSKTAKKEKLEKITK